jgi:hypothetical protein
LEIRSTSVASEGALNTNSRTMRNLRECASIAFNPLARHRILILCVAAIVLAYVDRRTSPPDAVYFARAGGQLLSGDLAAVYAADYNQSGPLQLIASFLFMPTGYSAGAQLIMHMAGNLTVMFALLAGCRVCRRALARSPAPGAELLIGGAAAVWVIPGDYWSGHLAQLAIPSMWFVSAELARTGRLATAAVVLGLSAGVEPWGVMAVPLLLIETRPRLVVRAACIFASVVGSLYVPFILAGNFHMFEHAWPIARISLAHALWPNAQEFTWGMRLAQGAVSALACGAVVLLLKRRGGVTWMAPLAAVLFRLLLDPTLFSYYWIPVCLLALVGASTLSAATSPLGVVSVLSLAYLPFIKTGVTVGLNLALTIGAAALCVYVAMREPVAAPLQPLAAVTPHQLPG